eukprot:3008140-Prorocentrum_lima.AAC.1
MTSSLVGSEMCIRDRARSVPVAILRQLIQQLAPRAVITAEHDHLAAGAEDAYDDLPVFMSPATVAGCMQAAQH